MTGFSFDIRRDGRKRGLSVAAVSCFVLCALVALASPGQGLQAAEPVVVASKSFPESQLLAEIMAQLLEARGLSVQRRLGLGSTMICYQALKRGEIDVYPEYTGTLGQAILGLDPVPPIGELRRLVARDGLRLLQPFGFNNTYAIVVPRSIAESRGLVDIGDLARQPDLRLAFSHEFVERNDGWPGLAKAYGLRFSVVGIEHGLAYQAIAEGRIDVTDAYSTDGDIPRYDLVTLRDSRGYFPEYLAIPFVRGDLPAAAVTALAALGGRIDESRMAALNARVVIDKETFAAVASDFLAAEQLVRHRTRPATDWWDELRVNTLVHLQLTGIALFAACAFGLPLGVLVYRSRAVSRVVLYTAGLLQTIPSIALLALMIPVFGIGWIPAVIALFLYSLLPIVRSTITALLTTDPLLRRVAIAMGLTPAQQIRHVVLPLALPNVLTGVKTAAVISIGTATLAAFIGAGGLGQPIVTGLSLNDPAMILRGAVPAALLAVLTELVFEILERRLVPAHMLSGRVID